MSNKQILIAFASKQPMSQLELNARVGGADLHLSRIMHGASITSSTDGRNGIVGWTTRDSKIEWPIVSTSAIGTAGWLHIPPNPSRQFQPIDPVERAFEVTYGRIARWEAGAPFACVTLSPSGELRVANDVFGLARLYKYEFEGLTVWSSRQGLAHVFAGEQPYSNTTTWHSMATLGWPILGRTHMGSGHQLPGYTLERIDKAGNISTEHRQADWLSDFSSKKAPSISETAESLQSVLRTSALWPSPPIADLSGGKDSRVIAAAAITSGATDTVRTVRTDHGEVDVAKSLVQVSPLEIKHLVQEVTAPSLTEGGVQNRLLSQQRVWEGHYLARSVYKAGVNPGIKASKKARLNGLGGEAIQGGALMGGTWRERINEGGQAVALDRLERLVLNPRATTSEAKTVTLDRFLGYARSVTEFGWSHPEAPINYVYNTDRMPHWSLPLGGRTTLVPFFAPAMLLHMARATREPRDYGGIHKELLSSLIPSWAEVPFYKPSPQTRATSFMWEYDDWHEARTLIEERSESSASFSAKAITEIFNTIEQGEGALADEAVLVKFLWETTFNDYLGEVARDAQVTAENVTNALAAQHRSDGIGPLV